MLADFVANSGDALIWFGACIAVGLIIDQIVFSALKRRARKKGFRTMAKVADALHWFPTAMGTLLGLALALRQLRLAPEHYRYAQTTLEVATIVVLTAFGARILGRLVSAIIQRDDVPVPGGSIFPNLARGIVWVVGALSLLATLGISIAPLLTALVVGGLAVGLALQPTLENAFSGIQLVTSRQIQPGDFIRLDTGDEGVVLDVTWRNTTIHKVTNDVVIVPNSVLARASVTNFTSVDPEFVLVVPVSFASAGDPDEVERITLEVARGVVADVEGAVPDSEPGCRFAELTPPAAVLNVTIRCRSYVDRIPVRHELIRRLAKQFAEQGVAAPPMALSPARRPGR